MVTQQHGYRKGKQNTVRYKRVGLPAKQRVCSVNSCRETTAMHVVECDPHCHQYSGCSQRGEGKCDSYCDIGYGLDPSSYTCTGE